MTPSTPLNFSPSQPEQHYTGQRRDDGQCIDHRQTLFQKTHAEKYREENGHFAKRGVQGNGFPGKGHNKSIGAERGAPTGRRLRPVMFDHAADQPWPEPVDCSTMYKRVEHRDAPIVAQRGAGDSAAGTVDQRVGGDNKAGSNSQESCSVALFSPGEKPRQAKLMSLVAIRARAAI